MSWPDLSSLHFDFTITLPAIIALFTVMLAVVSCWIAIRTYRRSHPRLTIEPILEVYDTRESRQDRIAWYWTIRIINDGGRAFALLGLRQDIPELPMVLLAKDSRLLEERPTYAVYITDVPRYEDVKAGTADLTKYKSKGFEEYSSVNMTVGPGEVKTLKLAFLVSYAGTAIDAIFFNIVLEFHIAGRRFFHKLSKMAQLVKYGIPEDSMHAGRQSRTRPHP
jgi:hypothetical protein